LFKELKVVQRALIKGVLRVMEDDLSRVQLVEKPCSYGSGGRKRRRSLVQLQTKPSAFLDVMADHPDNIGGED